MSKIADLSGWHAEAARRTSEVALASHAHANARQTHLESYIGYHEPHYLNGHMEAIDTARERAFKFEKRGKSMTITNGDHWKIKWSVVELERVEERLRKG